MRRVRRSFGPMALGAALVAASVLAGAAPAEAATQPPPSPFVLPCTGESSCSSLVFNSSGSVQSKPLIYLLFWGSQWNTAPYSTDANKIIKFFRLLPGSDWQEVLHPYHGTNGHIKGVTYGGAAVDSSDPPVLGEHPDAQIDPVIQSAAASQQWTMTANTQVIVFTEPGKSNVTYCGVHGSDGSATARSSPGSPTPPTRDETAGPSTQLAPARRFPSPVT